MLNLLFLILQFILLIQLLIAKRFEYHDYDYIYNQIVNLSINCSHYIKIDTSQHRYKLDSAEPCILNGKNSSCETLIVYMTDFSSYDNKRPQIYISGLLHGDEILGSIAILEFITYFCQKDNPDNSFENNILRERIFIFTPITNTYGFSNSIREDKIVYRDNKTVSYVDPNTDFPYFNSHEPINDQCMRSITSRTINEIFKEHIIVSAISFHGGMNVIGYPWGNSIHLNKEDQKKATESPDYIVFNEIADILSNYSDSKLNNDKGINKYKGDSVNGGMEDWAYAGSWENIVNKEVNPIKECKPQTYGVYDNQTQYDDTSLRAMILIVDTSDEKKPIYTKLGFDDNYESQNNTMFNRRNNFYGHIIKNMRLIWGTADLISAYFYINYHSFNQTEHVLYFSTILSGCKTVESITQYQILIDRKQALTYESLSDLSLLINQSSIVQELKQTKCYWCINNDNDNDTDFNKLEEEYSLNYSLSINKTFLSTNSGSKTRHKFIKMILTYIKGTSPDIAFLNQQSPDPSIKPQTHLVKHKTNSSYSPFNENYHLTQNAYFYSNPIAIVEDGTIFEIDSPEALLYNGNDLTLSYSIYSTNEEFSFNKTKIIPFTHLTPVNKRTTTKISHLTFKVSVGIFISTSDYGHSDMMVFIEKDDSFLLFYSANEEITAEVILDGEEEESTRINCVIYKTMIKKYYVLCDNIFENTTIGNSTTIDVLREKVLNSHIKLEIEYLNMTLYATFTLINNNYLGKSNDIMLRDNTLICNSNPSISYQLDYYNERNISTSNLTQLYYNKNVINYKIKMNKISNYHYIVSLDILNNDTLRNNSTSNDSQTLLNNDTIALVFPLNYHFIAGNYSTFQNVHLYLNKSLVNTRLIGKGVYIINLGKSISPDSLNITFLKQIITHRLQKEYQITICSIDNEYKNNKDHISLFYNTHTKRIPKQSAKFMITIGIVSTGSIAIIIVAVLAVLCLIQRYKRRGYSSVSSKKTIEFEQY